MKLKQLKDLEVSGKRVLLRIDLNLPRHHGKVTDATRIIRALPTIQYLINNNAKVIIISHLGRPKGSFDRDLSLAPITDELEKHIGKIVKFCTETIGARAQNAANRLKDGEVLLLENLRFHEGEEVNDPDFTKKLAELGDVFVGDTFSCAHRKHASIWGLAQLLPSAAGFLLHDELANIEKLMANPARPFTAIVGGAKISTKLGLLSSLLIKVDNLFIGGAMANTFLKAQDIDIGGSMYEAELLGEAKAILDQAKAMGKQLILPSDFIAESDEHSVAVHRLGDKLSKHHRILDVGPGTLHDLHEIVEGSKSLMWNGPLGIFEDLPFSVSTLGVARIIANRTSHGGLYSIAGGGDTLAAIKAARLQAGFSYISTGGGAFLEWLEGKELPGVSALTYSTCSSPRLSPRALSSLSKR